MILVRIYPNLFQVSRPIQLQSGKLGNKKAHAKKYGPFVSWLPIVDEFRNFLMSEEADIVLEQIKDF